MTPWEEAARDLDEIDRAVGIDACPYWRPLYVPPAPTWRQVSVPLRHSYGRGGCTLTTIDGILKQSYDELVAEMNQTAVVLAPSCQS